MAHGFSPPETCPVCGETVPPGARACPGCGADERSGWNEEATRYDGLDLPASAFDDSTERAARRNAARGLGLIMVVGVLVLLVFGLLLMR